MNQSKRISLSLLDQELLALINASAKIFPITQQEADDHSNPEGYEYGRVGNHIYRWTSGRWEYIIADDVDINWNDIKDKPTAYEPLPHDHARLHEHLNKSLLDNISQEDIALWDGVVSKADAIHTHPYAEIEHTHHTDYYLKSEIDYRFENIPEASHNHDGRYYKKQEIDGKLTNKADTDHTHPYAPSEHALDNTIHVTLEDKQIWNDKAPFKYEAEFLELRDHYGYMPIDGGGFDGNDGYYLMYDGGEF